MNNLVLNSLIKKGTIPAKKGFLKGEGKPLRGLCMLLREIINTKGDINLFDQKLIKSLNLKSQDDLLEYYYSLLFKSRISWLYDPYKVCVLYDLDKDAYSDIDFLGRYYSIIERIRVGKLDKFKVLRNLFLVEAA